MNAGWLVVAMGAAAAIVGGYVALLALWTARSQKALDALRKERVRS